MSLVTERGPASGITSARLADRSDIMVTIAQDNPITAIDLDLVFDLEFEFEARRRPIQCCSRAGG
jgi:hypothetical protein